MNYHYNNDLVSKFISASRKRLTQKIMFTIKTISVKQILRPLIFQVKHDLGGNNTS